MEKLLLRINGFGKYQKFILFLVGLLSLMRGYLGYSSIFTTAKHELKCIDKINHTIVPTSQSCEIWSALKKNSSGLSEAFECHFSDEYYGSSMVNEWGFECHNFYKATFAHTAHMSGGLFSFLGGWFSDRHGRKIVVKVCFVGIFVAMGLCEIINQKLNMDVHYKYTIYLITQFLLGFFVQVGYVSAYILAIELCSNKKTTLITAFNAYMYIVGMILLMALAYFSRDWHLINSYLAIYAVFIILLIFLVLPESPRFLLSKKKYEQCYAILKRLAQVNKRSDQLFGKEEFLKHAHIKNNPGNHENDKLEEQIYFHEIQSLLSLKISNKARKKSFNSSTVIDAKSEEATKEAQSEAEPNVSLSFFLMNPVKNLIYSLLIMFVWAVLAMTYFTISLGITSVGNNINPYTMYIFGCIAEAVGYITCYFHNKYSLKKLVLILMFLMEVVVIVQIFLPEEIHGQMTWRTHLIILISSAGKALSSAAFTTIYVYTIKMYPTTVRNTMYAACVSFGRVGSLISPQINLLRFYTWEFMPNVIYSVSTTLGILILAFLPDPSRLV